VSTALSLISQIVTVPLEPGGTISFISRSLGVYGKPGKVSCVRQWRGQLSDTVALFQLWFFRKTRTDGNGPNPVWAQMGAHRSGSSRVWSQIPGHKF
jgi:hypothetical protein